MRSIFTVTNKTIFKQTLSKHEKHRTHVNMICKPEKQNIEPNDVNIIIEIKTYTHTIRFVFLCFGFILFSFLFSTSTTMGTVVPPTMQLACPISLFQKAYYERALCDCLISAKSNIIPNQTHIDNLYSST